MLFLLAPAHVAVWALRLLVVMPLWLLGFPVVLVLSLLHAWEPRRSRFFVYSDGSRRLLAQWRPRWAFPWGNEEDGIAGPRAFMFNRPAWLRAFVWSAWRNPVNNLRFVYPFGIRIDPRRVRFVGNVDASPIDDERAELEFLRRVEGDEREAARFRWSYTWQGLFAGVWIRVPLFGRIVNVRCGYKLLPRDAEGVPASDYRSAGAAFGVQLQLRELGR